MKKEKTLQELQKLVLNIPDVMRSTSWNIYCYIRDLDKTPLYFTLGVITGICIFSGLMVFARFLESL